MTRITFATIADSARRSAQTRTKTTSATYVKRLSHPAEGMKTLTTNVTFAPSSSASAQTKTKITYVKFAKEYYPVAVTVVMRITPAICAAARFALTARTRGMTVMNVAEICVLTKTKTAFAIFVS